MEELLKQDKSGSHKEFEKLLVEDLGNRKFKEGEIATGIVEEVGKKFVFIDLGLKSSGAIPIEEFKLTKEKIDVGSKVDVLLERIENRDGEIVLYFKVNTLKLNHFRGWTVHNGRLLELFTMRFVLVFYRVTHLLGTPQPVLRLLL